MSVTNGDLAEWLGQRFDALDAVFDGPKVVSAKWDSCPQCGSEGSVWLVGTDGSVRARCLGIYGTDCLGNPNDESCHGTLQVNLDNFWELISGANW